MFYEQRLKRLKKEQKMEVEKLEYWCKVEKEFEKRKKKKEEKFSMDFEHKSQAGYSCDDEAIIEFIAKLYGYKVVDENITSLNTKYIFAISTNNN